MGFSISKSKYNIAKIQYQYWAKCLTNKSKEMQFTNTYLPWVEVRTSLGKLPSPLTSFTELANAIPEYLRFN